MMKNQIKEKIETSYNLREEDLQIDFENSYNIDNIWLGSRFSVFLSNKYADFIENDDIIWIYILERGIKHTKTRRVYKYEYSLIFVDKNGNEYNAKISKQNCTRILNIYEGRYPNLYVGYSAQLESMLKTDINNFYSFDKNTLEKNIIKTY